MDNIKMKFSIDELKKEFSNKSGNLNESRLIESNIDNNNIGIKKGTVLKELFNGVKFGLENNSVKLIKDINNTTSIALNEGNIHKSNTEQSSRTTPNIQSNQIMNNSIIMNQKNDDDIYNDIVSKNRESFSKYRNQKNNSLSEEISSEITQKQQNFDYSDNKMTEYIENSITRTFLKLFTEEMIVMVLENNPDLLKKILMDNKNILKSVMLEIVNNGKKK